MLDDDVVENGLLSRNKRESLSTWDDDSNPNEMWGRMSRLIKDIAKEVWVKPRIGLQKDTWWWNSEVERAHEKKNQFKIWHKSRNMVDWKNYKFERMHIVISSDTWAYGRMSRMT